MSKGGNKVEETSQQRAAAAHAMNLFKDYQKRWLPVQKQLATQIQATGAEDSAARKGATGRASTDTAMQFAQAQGALEKALSNNGANVNSSRAKLAVSGMGEDAAKAKGMGAMIADQQIDDAYTQGLTALTSIGRGERAQVGTGLADQATSSARTAAADAEASAAQRAGYAQLAGQAAGMGLYGALQPGPKVPDMVIDTNGMGVNGTGTRLPTAGGM